MRVVAFVPDLLDRSRIAGAGGEVTFVAAPEALGPSAAGADLVVVDLSRPGVLDVLGTLDTRVVGFGPHVDEALLAAARAAGCDEVLPRSVFFRRLHELLGRT